MHYASLELVNPPWVLRSLQSHTPIYRWSLIEFLRSLVEDQLINLRVTTRFVSCFSWIFFLLRDPWNGKCIIYYYPSSLGIIVTPPIKQLSLFSAHRLAFKLRLVAIFKAIWYKQCSNSNGSRNSVWQAVANESQWWLAMVGGILRWVREAVLQ